MHGPLAGHGYLLADRAEYQVVAIPLQRSGLHDGVVAGDRDDPAPTDPATVEHVQRLSDDTVAQQPHERVDAENVEAVVGERAVRDGLRETRPGPARPTTETLVQRAAEEGRPDSVEERAAQPVRLDDAGVQRV